MYLFRFFQRGIVVCVVLCSMTMPFVSVANTISTSSLQQLLASVDRLQIFLQQLSPSVQSVSPVGSVVWEASYATSTPPGYVSFTSEVYQYSTTTQLAILNLADIDVLKRSDTDFYITGTTVGDASKIKVYHTTDLKTFTLVVVYKPSLATTTADYCSVWAPDLSYVGGNYLLTFSAQKRAEGQACEDIHASLATEPTLYQVQAKDMYSFGVPKALQYGSVVSGDGHVATAMKIDPDFYNNRMYYVWFDRGNNISSVETVSPYSTLLHTLGSSWNESGINEAPQLFTRNGTLYLQFSVYGWKEGYTTKYIKGVTPTDLVRTSSNTKTLAAPIAPAGCDLATETCVIENYGHGAIFSKNEQFYYLHHRAHPSSGDFTRNAYLTPIYFKSNGDMVSMTNTQLSWNQLGSTYKYSLDVLPVGGTWVSSCVGANVLGNQTTYNYNGLCTNTSATVARKQEIAKFRLCYSSDGRWDSTTDKCKVIANKLSSDSLQITLVK